MKIISFSHKINVSEYEKLLFIVLHIVCLSFKGTYLYSAAPFIEIINLVARQLRIQLLFVTGYLWLSTQIDKRVQTVQIYCKRTLNELGIHIFQQNVLHPFALVLFLQCKKFTIS